MKKQKSIGRERLAKLAAFLHRVPRKKFDMERWATMDFNIREQSCGTAACAVGWAATIFKAEQFRLIPSVLSGLPKTEYKGKENWEAVAEFFSMGRTRAIDLFGIENDDNLKLGPRQVAKRIKRYLKTGKVSKGI